MNRRDRAALNRLRQWHKDLGISKSGLAALVRVDQSFMSRVLAGVRGVGLATAEKIEHASKAWKHGPILRTEWSCHWHTGLPVESQPSASAQKAAS
jgi:hypothetical protein